MERRFLARAAVGLFVAASVVALGMTAMRDRAGRHAVGTADAVPAAPAAPAGARDASAPVVSAGHQVVAYYFHRTTRCNTCRSIESQAAATIAREFAPDVDRGALTWRAVNVDEPQFEHFVEDYDLSSSSLVLVELQDGNVQRWKSLQDVWGLVDDPPRFAQYVATHVREYLGGTS